MINSFVRRFYSGPTPTDNSFWAIPGGPGDSTTSFTGFAQVVTSRDPTITFYLVDPRGTGGSSFLSCDNQPGTNWNPYNKTSMQPWISCMQQIMDKYSNVLGYYSNYHAALDIISVVNAVNPAKVAIYGLSCGTYLTNQYLLLGGRVDVLVLDGPVAPTRWAMENGAKWSGKVLQDVLNTCSQQSPTCQVYNDVMAHAPDMLMDSIIDGTLPCLQKLPWLNQFVMANINMNLLQGGLLGIAALSPFWYRLWHCSDSDVEQLTHYYQTQYHTEGAPPTPADYSTGVALNIAASELYSFAPRGKELDYDSQIELMSRMTVSGSAQYFISYAISEMKWPQYTVKPQLYLTYAKPTVPVIILVGTFDSNTPYGMSQVFANGLRENNPQANVNIGTVPYSLHGTLEATAYCVQSIIVPFMSAFGSQPANFSCLPRYACIYARMYICLFILYIYMHT